MYSQLVNKDTDTIVRIKEGDIRTLEMTSGQFNVSNINETNKQKEISYMGKMGINTNIQTNINKANDTNDNYMGLLPLIGNIMSDMKIPASIKGYRYLRCAIILCIYDYSHIDAITKKLYPTIAKEFKTTPSRVERAMRHAISKSWDAYLESPNGFHPYILSLLNTFDHKPTNSEFVAILTDRLHYGYTCKE